MSGGVVEPSAEYPLCWDLGAYLKQVIAQFGLLTMLTLLVVGCVPAGTPTELPPPPPLGVAPHRFYGTVLLADGSVAPDGTVVAALIGGEVVATATVESSFQPGFYLLDVASPAGESFVGKTVFFTIDRKVAAESAEWLTRESVELDLKATNATPTPTVLTTPTSMPKA